MAEVQRGNVFLTIDDADINKYMAKGFSVVDKNGKVIKQSVPTELGQLQKAYSEHVELIKQKDTEIASLKAELQALKTAGEKKSPAAKPKAAKKEEIEETESDWDDWADAEEVEEEKPVKKSKKSK